MAPALGEAGRGAEGEAETEVEDERNSRRRGLLRDDVIILQDDGSFIAENVA